MRRQAGSTPAATGRSQMSSTARPPRGGGAKSGGERWSQFGVAETGAPRSTGIPTTFAGPITAPGESLSEDYIHQYYAILGVNDADGGGISGSYRSSNSAGSITPAPGWWDAGISLYLTASANTDWQFEGWTGSGVGAQNGTQSSVIITVAGPFTEHATFYVQLAIAADPGTNIAYSYGSESGTVGAGNATVLYIPPGSNVTLRATPFSFLYNFGSWLGTGLDNSTRPEVSL